MKKINLLTLLFLLSTAVFSQTNFAGNVKGNDNKSKKPEKIELKRIFDIGAGFGLDYGGIGAKATFIPVKHLGVFVSAGHHIVNFGWQVGAIGYILPKTNVNKIRPYAKVMYGTNRAIMILGNSKRSDNYTGITFGAGMEFRFGAKKSHGLNVDLNFPISSSEFKDAFYVIKNDPNYEINEPLPVAVSFGYHFEF